MSPSSTASSRQDRYAPDAESPTLAVEVKLRLSGVRGLRDALAQLAGYLGHEEGKRALLWLVDPKITRDRVTREWRRLAAVLRPEIAERLTFVVSRDGRFEEKPPELGPNDWRFLEGLGITEAAGASSLPRPDLQSEVVRVMVLRWIDDGGPVTSRWLQETVGCNYRTVAAALGRLGKAVKRHSSRRVELRYFPKDEWARLLATSDSSRATRRFVHRSGPPRSAESLFRRLQGLERTDLAVGGVLGAKHYYPDLDLMGTPRLDVCVHSPARQADLEFVRRLDPALEETSEPEAPARLALHFLRRREPLFERDSDGRLWADPVECLLDLHEARLETQALEFFQFLSARREASEPRS